MFGGGKIKVINQDGDLYINMWELAQHLLMSAYVMKSMTDYENSNIVAETLAELTTTIAELAMYELEKTEIDNVDEILASWLDMTD